MSPSTICCRAGFEVVGSSLKAGAGSAGCDYVDMREDRNVFFTAVNPYSMVIEYQIKPCNRGQFVVPPIYASSMYNRAIKANGIAGQHRGDRPEMKLATF